MAQVNLSAIKAGITRLRVKGGASPDSLYEFVNGYVTAARTLAPRPGSEIFEELPSETIGLALFNGTFQIFSSEPVSGLPARFKNNVLTPPTDSDPLDPPTLVRIWKSEPLMGGLYVVAEWSDDPTRAIHYWLRSMTSVEWEAGKMYMLGDVVVPTGGNGVAYSAGRAVPAATTWRAGMEVEVGMEVEPTTFNGYRYVAEEVYGDPARTGASEPAWVATDGSTTIEDADADPESTTQTVDPSGDYGNPGGSGIDTYKYGNDPS